ncbi:hypothetical protein VUR80DRAFT_5654 [Thermomyces stellatus]
MDNKVELIPWDPTSEEQVERLYDQRVACGWHEEAVPRWREAQLNGTKVTYWIVLAHDLLGRQELIAQHLARYPKEREPLVDTTSVIWNASREATHRHFIPVGHLSLETATPPEAKDMTLASPSTVWLYQVYISWALQRRGLGRSALTVLERTAASPPVNATVIALNTLQKDTQQSEVFLKKAFDDRGMARPAEVRTNQDWYMRQGYQVTPGPANGKYIDTTTKEVETVPIVWLKKHLI